MDIHMKKILVTGGAGYVGSGLLRDLLKNGYVVDCVDCLKFGGESLIDIWNEPNFTFHHLDLTDFIGMDQVLRRRKYEVIVHLAAIVGDPACKRWPEEAKKLNWSASKFLLEKAIEYNTERFIFASTCSNYGKMPNPNEYVNEDSPLAPVSLYAELKVKFEELLLKGIKKKDDFCPIALRFSTVYGLSNRMRFDLTINEFTKELACGNELLIFGEQFWRPYCHVQDFSRAIISVIRAPKEKVAYDVFNVGTTDENYTKQMIVNEIVKQIPQGKIKYVQKDEDPRDYRVDFSKIRNVLNFEVSKRVPDGIKEVKDIIQMGVITDPNQQRYYNIPKERS
jgi:nucleoside-diphosphate-sugar epimerase